MWPLARPRPAQSAATAQAGGSGGGDTGRGNQRSRPPERVTVMVTGGPQIKTLTLLISRVALHRRALV